MRSDRHGRGSREIYSTSAFEADLLDGVERLKEVWGATLRGVEFACDEVPETLGEEVPLGSLSGRRITLYRLPISLRATTSRELSQLIFDTLVEQVADLLGMEPSEVHDEYGIE